MTVKEVLEKGIKEANEKRNNWVKVINIEELKHCYITSIDSNITFTLFLSYAETVTLIRPISDQVGISINSDYFVYADAIKVIDMQTMDEFIINKDGIEKRCFK